MVTHEENNKKSKKMTLELPNLANMLKTKAINNSNNKKVLKRRNLERICKTTMMIVISE